MNLRTNHIALAALAAAALMAGSTASAQAGYLDTAYPTKNNGDFIAGHGIPGDNFWVGGGDFARVALKGRQRDTGEPLSRTGNEYHVATGLADDGTNPAWNFDFQYTPLAGEANALDGLQLMVDFDPGVGSTDFATIDLPLLGGWDTTFADGFFLNPSDGSWSSDNVPFVYSQSWNMGYGFWGKAFDPFADGEYEIRLMAYRNSDIQTAALTDGQPLAERQLLASSDILVVAGDPTSVPEPATLGLMGVGLAGLGFARWRKRK